VRGKGWVTVLQSLRRRSAASWLAALVTIFILGLAASPRVASAATPGTKLWASLYHGPVHGTGEAFKVAVSPDGSKVFVTGLSDGVIRPHVEISDYATVAYDAATGAQLWAARYDGAADLNDIAVDLGVSPDGSKVFVTGFSESSTNGLTDYATVAYDAATGAQLWATRYNGPANGADSATSLAVSPDGSKVFVTGYSTTSVGDNADYVTLAYDTSTGDKVWLKRYERPGWDSPSSIAVSRDGSDVFVTGYSTGSTSSYDYATVAYDAATGAKRWAIRYNGPANRDDQAYALGVSPDGSKVFVTGRSEGSTSGSDYATVAYDATTGAQLWAKRYNGPADREDVPFALGVSPDGSMVFVTGYSIGSTSVFNYATLAYNTSSGTRLWLTRYSGPDGVGASAASLAVSPDGSQVFVTGSSGIGVNVGGTEYATFAYDAATGAKVWGPKHYTGEASSIAVSPDGSKVFVTGAGRGYATVAYEAA